MLEIRELTKEFGGRRAVDSVSLRIPQGQMVGIIGRSGAGKSTLLRMINRMAEPSSGSIQCDGREVTKLSGRELRAWRRECAMIFQQFNLVDRLDVVTNVLIGRLNLHATLPALFKRFSAAERAMAIKALDRLDMAQAALQRAGTLSGGQQQRVAIARALVQEPRLLLADEPIASLDPRNAGVVMDALRRINKEDGITVICNLHTLDTARAYCDRIVALSKGAVVFDGLPGELTDAKAAQVYGIAPEAEAATLGLTKVSLAPARAAS